MPRKDDDAIFGAVMEVAIGVPGFCAELETEQELQIYLRDYNEAERTVVSTWGVCNEVYDGGHWQLYINSTGAWPPESVAGFNRISHPHISVRVEKSLAVFLDWRTAVSTTRRRKVLRNVEEGNARFKDLDREFAKARECLFTVAQGRFARDRADQLGISE